ncbi:MAG: hypothetical protein R3268_10205 [Acidiferrobacterales bacterium]|nr:hypothetical protein [Acidiferrobacterales bacterium]
MADHSGIALGDPYVLSGGRNAPSFRYEGEAGNTLDSLGQYGVAGDHVSVDEGGASVGGGAHTAELFESSTIGFDWFDKVHLVPRSGLAFGNIITQQQLTFELFSAHRSDITLVGFVNNAGAGLTVPDLPATPATLPKFTSFLDPTTTALMPVLLPVVASPDGVPSFDTTLDFTFDSGELVKLDVSGNRIALITAIPHVPIREILEFNTDVLPALSGKEQRISNRKQPRQGFRNSYDLLDEERRRLQALLFGWTPNIFGVPLWHEQVYTTAAASASATSVTVDSTTDVDFRVDGLGVVFTDEFTYDVIIISAVTANTITFTTSPLVNSYPEGTRVMPVRLCNLIEIPRGRRPLNNLEAFELVFECVDNDTGAPTADTGWNSNTYGGKILLDECNVQKQQMVFELPQKIARIDNRTGAVYQNSRWPHPRRLSSKGFGAHTRSEILSLKRLLLSTRGKQKSFYLPTFIEDLEVVASLTSGSDTMDIGNIGFSRFVLQQGHKRIFRITFTDGTSLVREIDSSSEISSTVERLTLNTTWPDNRSVSDITRVQFYELVRFDNDYFEIVHDRVGSAFLLAPVRTIFE